MENNNDLVSVNNSSQFLFFKVRRRGAGLGRDDVNSGEVLAYCDFTGSNKC